MAVGMRGGRVSFGELPSGLALDSTVCLLMYNLGGIDVPKGVDPVIPDIKEHLDAAYRSPQAYEAYDDVMPTCKNDVCLPESH